MFNLNEILTATADKEALIIPDSPVSQTITYGDLRQLVNDFKTRLGVHLDASRKPIIAMILPNSCEFVIALLGIVGFGGIAAPLHPDYMHDELLYYVKDMKASLILTHSSLNTKVMEDVSCVLGLRLLFINYLIDSYDKGQESIGSLEIFESDRFSHYFPQKHEEERVARLSDPHDLLPSDVALLLYTSGTTGTPKAVLLTHMNVGASIRNTIESYQLNSEDRCLLVMPLFHVHGMIGCLLSTLASEGTVVLPTKFSATNFWKICVKYRCTWFSAVPTIHTILLEHQKQTQPSITSTSRIPHQLRFIRSCSSYLTPATWTLLEETFHTPVLQAYAMTEAAHQVTTNQLHAYKRGSVGHAVGSVEVAIWHTQHGVTHLPDVVGEVLVRGETLMTYGYRNLSLSTVFTEDRWFKTGDLGYLDKDGFLFLQGRSKEMINRAGEKFSPLEVTSVLMSHPNVCDAITFAVPHPIYGESVHAAVVPTSDCHSDLLHRLPLELDALCRTRLANFKCPERIHILDHLPKTKTGKIHLPSLLDIVRSKL